MNRNISSKEFLIILLLIVAKLTIHLATNTNYEVHRDGLLYYSLGEHLAWGYASVPPFIAWVSSFSVMLFGNTTFALRFFPMLVGGASILVLSSIVSNLGGRWKAILIAGLAFLLSPAFLRSNTLLQPASFNQFFWLYLTYLIIRLIKTRNTNIWLWIFVVFGIAFLNKYSIVFFAMGLFVALMLSKHRWLIFSKHFLWGIGLGFIIILPNLFWQYQHNWPVVHHMGELYESQLVNVSPAGFIIDQIMMNFPGVIVWMTGLFVFFFKYSEKKYRFITYVWLITVLILLFSHGKSYYTLGLYTSLLALGGFVMEKYWKNWVMLLIAFFILVCGVFMAPISLPVLSLKGLAEFTKKTAPFTNRWVDGQIHELPQDFADMTGWKQLAKKADSCYVLLPKHKQRKTTIFADNYGQAGALLFYNNISDNKPISFNDSFVFWAPESIECETLMMINHEIDSNLCQYFDTCYIMAQVNDKYFREDGVKVMLYDGAKPSFAHFYSQEHQNFIKKYIREK